MSTFEKAMQSLQLAHAQMLIDMDRKIKEEQLEEAKFKTESARIQHEAYQASLKEFLPSKGESIS